MAAPAAPMPPSPTSQAALHMESLSVKGRGVLLRIYFGSEQCCKKTRSESKSSWLVDRENPGSLVCKTAALISYSSIPYIKFNSNKNTLQGTAADMRF